VKEYEMGSSNFWIIAVVALLGGAILGALLTWNTLNGRFGATVRRMEAELRDKVAAAADKSRVDLLRLQSELAERKTAQAKEIAAAIAEPRSAVVRLEQRLQAAYAELDKLRAQVDPKSVSPLPAPKDGFAATQPMTSKL
jgi:hypothetical protein